MKLERGWLSLLDTIQLSAGGMAQLLAKLVVLDGPVVTLETSAAILLQGVICIH